MATPEQLRRRGRWTVVVAIVLAALSLGAVIAYADQVIPDGDIVTSGDQSNKDLGTVAPGAVLTPKTSFTLSCNGTHHVDLGQSVSLTFTLAGSTVPSGGALSATNASIGPIPASWPDDNSGCSPTPTPIQDNGDSTITITAPAVPGSYSYTVKWNSSVGSPDVTGTVQVVYSLTVVAADTTPPTLHLPADITAEATSGAGAVVSFTATADDANPAHPAVGCSPASGSTFALGATTVNCSATDAAGNTSNGSFKVSVVDTTAPSLTLPSDMTVEATSPSGAVVSFAASASDLVDGAVPVGCSPASGTTFGLGTTTVNCSATDAAGNAVHGSFEVSVVDTTAPSLSLPSDIIVEATGPAGAAASYTASALDQVDGPVAVSCSPASGSTFALGTTTVNCSATDAAGNTGQGSFKVSVVDTTPPLLAVPSAMTLEATGPSGAVATFAASASDLVDGSVAVVCVPASGSTFQLGDTTVACSATDAAGNPGHGYFMVTVVDTTAPTLTLPSNMTVEATGPSGAVVPFTASASDLVDGAVPVGCSPASGSPFALGATTVNCSATDVHGNTTSGSFMVTVEDTTSPALTLPSNMTVEATGPSGAAVSFTASASDLVSGSVPITCSPASGSTFALGATTVNCSATDAHGNTAQGSFKITVVDTTPPALNLPADIVTTAPGNSQKIVTYSASATDVVDGPVAITCTPASGSSFPVGVTTVNCSATDANGNTAHGSFKVTVTYGFKGFFQPVDNLPTVNSVKAGSSVPLKFSLSGNQGMTIFAPGSPASATMTCGGSDPVDVVEEIATPGSSGLSYDPTTDQYIYVWKTEKAWAGTCRQLVVKLADGSSQKANFKLTR